MRLFLLLLIAGTAHAHHGRDFLMVQDYSVPAPFTGIVYNNAEFASYEGPGEWSLEPGVVFGAGAGFSFDIASRFSDAGNGWDYSSVMPRIQYQLTPADSDLPLKLGLSAGYQFAQNPEEPHLHPGGGPCGPEFGPDAPACDDLSMTPHDHGHAHTGIHQHNTSALITRFIMETSLTPKIKFVANVIHVVPEGGSAAWGYAAGLRHTFSDKLAAGIEAVGDFDSAGYQEAAIAAYFSPSHHFTLKLGAGAGLTGASPDFTLQTGMVWRF